MAGHADRPRCTLYFLKSTQTTTTTFPPPVINVINPLLEAVRPFEPSLHTSTTTLLRTLSTPLPRLVQLVSSVFLRGVNNGVPSPRSRLRLRLSRLKTWDSITIPGMRRSNESILSIHEDDSNCYRRKFANYLPMYIRALTDTIC